MKEQTAKAPVLIHPFEAIARKLRVLKITLIFILIAFLLGGLLVLRAQFTAENLRFLVRDLNISTPSLGLDASNISFDYDTSQSAELYHSDLVILRRSALEVYSFSGARSLSAPIAYSSPALVVGDKYMLAYDIGGAKLGIYNSFSELYTETFDYKIACADLADDGTFAVVTGEKGYHSALYVYNSDFQRMFRYATAERVVYDMAFCDENPRLIALCAVHSQNGDFFTEVLLFDITKAEVQKTFSITGEMPLEIKFETEKHVSLVTDTALHLFDVRREEDTLHTFEADSLASYYAEGGYEVLVTNSALIGTTLEVAVIYPSAPEEEVRFTLDQQVQDILIAHDRLYLLSHDALTVFSLNDHSTKTHKLQNEFKEILPLTGDRVAFVGEGSVSIYMVG